MRCAGFPALLSLVGDAGAAETVSTGHFGVTARYPLIGLVNDPIQNISGLPQRPASLPTAG